MDKIKWYRCQFCHRLLNDRRIALGQCSGHRIKVCGYVTFREWLGIKLGIIR